MRHKGYLLGAMEARQADEVFTVSPSPIPEPEPADAKGGGVRRLRLYCRDEAMNESLRAQLRLLEKLFDAKLEPIGRDLTAIKKEVTGSCKRIATLEKDVTKLRNRNNCRQSRAELRLKRWHVWAIILGYVLLAGSAIVAAVI